MSNDAGSNPGDPDDNADNPFKGTPFEQIFGSFASGGCPTSAASTSAR